MKGFKKNIRVMISGGGTGGHIFPAVSIADELKRVNPETEIQFVGAVGRMEMERVPAAGYQIKGLPVQGFQRKLTLNNIKVLWNAFRSTRMARKMVGEFGPDIAIGVGGYASGPLLRAAANMGVPTLLQEQNSYAGVTNKLLAKRAVKICVAYKNMDRFFPAEKIVLTGNPVRKIEISEKLRKEGLAHFNLDEKLPTLLVVGGSLGARTLNNAMLQNYDLLAQSEVQVIWATGKFYYEEMCAKIKGREIDRIKVLDFVSRMDLAYNVADLMISRSGAISISEICLTGSASILVPSPNVAEDHQTKNAMALVKENAALLVKDVEAVDKMIVSALDTLKDKAKLKELSENSLKMARPDATAQIVDEVYKIVEA